MASSAEVHTRYSSEVGGVGFIDVLQVAVGSAHACALVKGGGVKCWGRNADGELGVGNQTESATPVDVQGLTGAKGISVYDSRTCAVTLSIDSMSCIVLCLY